VSRREDPVVAAKKPYEKPKLTEYGTVSDLTRTVGSMTSDTGFSGSMEFPGMGMN